MAARFHPTVDMWWGYFEMTTITSLAKQGGGEVIRKHGQKIL